MKKKVVKTRRQHRTVPVVAGSPVKVTLTMVAQLAGVSPSTASRILNRSALVSEDKRLAVEQAIASLGFVPNPAARAMLQLLAGQKPDLALPVPRFIVRESTQRPTPA